MLAAAGVRMHKTYLFTLPREAEGCIAVCRDLEATGWVLTVRIVDVNDGSLVFRTVDSDAGPIATAVARLPLNHLYTATITPNKNATISGTILVRKGDACMEMIYGPHHWLTKSAPEGVTVLRCWYCFPHCSVRYSTDQLDYRLALFQNLRDVVRIALGMSLRQLSHTRSALYVEYQWNQELGYKFFDCSYSEVWTGGFNTTR